MKLKELIIQNCDDYVSVTGVGTDDFKITLVGGEKDLIDIEIGSGDNTYNIEACESELKNLMIGIGRFLENINKELK